MGSNSELLVNERSEGGVIISEMNLLFARKGWLFSVAVGELSLKSRHADDARNETLFPDAIIYKDQQRLQPVMGWEFKMPDTTIDNEELISNAKDKANRMGTEVFVLWNFQYCAIYYRNPDRTWPSTPSKLYSNHADVLKNRTTVGQYERIWQSQLAEVLSDLNEDLVNQEYHVAPIEFHIADYVDTIAKKLAPITSDAYLAIQSPQFRSKVREWYRNEKAELSDVKSVKAATNQDIFLAFAKNVIIRWVNRILFCNIARRQQNDFSKILAVFDNSGNISEFADNLNKAISTTDFYSILHVDTDEDQLPELVVDNLVEFSRYLWQADMSATSSNFVSKSLESMVTTTKRELMGLYTTPKPLARLLVNMALVTTEGNYADVTVGSGTIAKALLDKLLDYKDLSYIHQHLWMSDKYTYPLQAANMNITSADSLNLMNIVFQANALSLNQGDEVKVTDPQTGTTKNLTYPKIDTITSNLPFISNNNRADDDRTSITIINKRYGLTARADIYQSILLHLQSLLNDTDNARIGVITSNSWMKNTLRGSFLEILSDSYDVERVIYSNVAKWFDNASVVATVLILKKKTDTPKKIQLIGLNVDIRSMEDAAIDQISDEINAESASSNFDVHEYSVSEINALMQTGISLEGLFDDISWLKALIAQKKLTSLSNIVVISRGTRTGRDEIYVTKGLMTDKGDSYPYLKTLKNVNSLKVEPSDQYLFYTNKTQKQLKDENHLQTLRYIQSKENTPDAITERVTKKKGENWYIPDDKPHYGDFVTSVNPNQRLFWSAFKEPSAMNQRGILARLRAEYSGDKELIHALLNSAVSQFILGASGFARAQGVTDLTADGAKRLSILNPELLNGTGKKNIINAWRSVVNIPTMDAVNQLEETNWVAFNRIVLQEFGINPDLYSQISASITRVMNRRALIGRS